MNTESLQNAMKGVEFSDNFKSTAEDTKLFITIIKSGANTAECKHLATIIPGKLFRDFRQNKTHSLVSAINSKTGGVVILGQTKTFEVKNKDTAEEFRKESSKYTKIIEITDCTNNHEYESDIKDLYFSSEDMKKFGLILGGSTVSKHVSGLDFVPEDEDYFTNSLDIIYDLETKGHFPTIKESPQNINVFGYEIDGKKIDIIMVPRFKNDRFETVCRENGLPISENYNTDLVKYIDASGKSDQGKANYDGKTVRCVKGCIGNKYINFVNAAVNNSYGSASETDPVMKYALKGFKNDRFDTIKEEAKTPEAIDIEEEIKDEEAKTPEAIDIEEEIKDKEAKTPESIDIEEEIKDEDYEVIPTPEEIEKEISDEGAE